MTTMTEATSYTIVEQGEGTIAVTYPTGEMLPPVLAEGFVLRRSLSSVANSDGTTTAVWTAFPCWFTDDGNVVTASGEWW